MEYKRGTGRTTRLCDKYINTLFIDGTTGPIYDHDNTYESNLMLSDMIMKRMQLEHKNIKIERTKGKNIVISIKNNKMIEQKNTVTQEDVDRNMQNILVRTLNDFGKPTTYVTVQMENGFTLRESTTCVDPANYNEEIGVKICLKKIEDKIWFLLGYQLQEEIYQEMLNRYEMEFLRSAYYIYNKY